MSKQTKTPASSPTSTSSTPKIPAWAINVLLPALFLLIMGLYFIGPISSGKVINQHDIVQNRGMAKEMMDYRTVHHEEALWNGRLFGGMPAFQIAMLYPNNWFSTVEKVVTLGLPTPYKQIWTLFITFFVMLLVCRVNPYLSFIGALAYAFSSYFFIILQVGHNTKAMAAALIPLIIAGTIMAYRGRYFAGAALVLLGLTLQMGANHIQVTYYMGIILIGLAVAALIEAIQQKSENNFFDNITIPRFAIASATLLLMAGLALLPNISRLWTTYEYTDVTMRGKGELSSASGGKSGLDIEYALRWSYGIMETFNLMIPNMYGGGTGGSESMTPTTYKLIKANMGKAKADDMIRGVPTYWGDQPFTSGPNYIGAGIVFLFIFSLVLGFQNIKDWQYGKVFTTAMIGVSLLAIMLSWGRHFQGLTDIFFNYFPLYNKFRAVAMILMIVQFMMPFMGIIALNEVMKHKEAKLQILKALRIAGGISLGIVVFIFLIGKMSWSFMGPEDKPGEALTEALIADRQSMFTFDVLRAIFWIVACGGLIWAWLEGRIKDTVLLLGIGASVLLDLWTVNKRYINDDDFVTSSKYQASIAATTKADEMILQDKSDFRVLNLSTSTFNDATTCYHHRSVGGYHPAKLRRYQDMIDANISPEIQNLSTILNKGVNDSTIRYAFSQTPVLNMMNTKYLIVQGEQPPLRNPNALGSAWFVSEIKQVNNADEELAALKGLNPKKTAIVSKDFAEQIAGFSPSFDSTASIKLLSYSPNEMKYESNSAKEGVAVFSEIYYEKGWEVSIDDKKVPHFRADWVLRGVKVPAGKHTITFKFAPESYIKGEQYALIGSIIVVLLLLGFVAADWYFQKKKNA